MSTGPPYAEVRPVPTEQDPETEESARSDAQLKWGSTRYEPISEIGVGAYGVVFKARDLQNDDGFVAMKCLRVENTEQGMPLSMVREIALLRQLETKEHPNVIKLLDVCLGRKTSHETQLVLVFEHMDQDLDMYLRHLPEQGLKAKEIKSIMQQILRGIDFLHSMRVIHRDLKPQNILITQSGTIKIADFGLARILSFEMALTAVVVTLWYRSPEVLLQDSYASPVDLWSVGCIFAELYNRRPLFRGTGDVNQLKKIFNYIGRPSEAEWPPDVAIPISSFPPQPPRSVRNFVPKMDSLAGDLFLKLLSFDPSLRPNAKSALEHEYFQVDPVVEEGGVLPGVNTSSAPLQHRRMPYAQRMTEGGVDSTGLGCHDNDVATTSKQVSAKTEKALSEHSQLPEPAASHRKKRSFGDVLPVTVKDGASGSLIAPESSLESAFLTPPSDMASSSSSGCETSSSSSSREFEPLTKVRPPRLAVSVPHACRGFEPPTEVRPPRSSPCEDRAPLHPYPTSDPSNLPAVFYHPDPLHDVNEVQVVKRDHKDSTSQSRMSWTSDYKPDPGGSGQEEPAMIAPSSRAGYKTPTYQILDSGKHVHPAPPEPNPPRSPRTP